MFDKQMPAAAAGYATLGGEAMTKQQAYADVQRVQGAPQPMSESDAAIQRIAHQIEMLQVKSGQVLRVADRLTGARPAEVAKDAVGNSASHLCLTNKLNIIADALSRLNADMSDSVDRLEAFI